jgi:hypothetical protein
MTLSFTPVKLAEQADFQSYLDRCPQLASDYSFINLWSWAAVYGLEWAFSEALVWIRQNRPETALWAPVGDWEKVDWQGWRKEQPRLFESFVRVPQLLCDIWRQAFGESVRAAEDRAMWDYLYDAAELKELKGNRFHRKKNLVNRFKKNHHHVFVEMDADMADRAMALQYDWCTWRTCDSSSQLAAENQAIMETLKNWESLNGVAGGCIFVEDLIVAYTIGERISEETLLIHFEKGCPAYKGAYQAINQMFIENQADAELQWVNREPDLGDEGLRKAKLSYHPSGFLKKYRVRL